MINLDTINNEFSGAIRNDILARKVYYNHPIFQQDTLLYDFALNVGDTVPRTIQNSMFPRLTVKDIDTVLINNKQRKRYTYWEGPHPEGYKFYVYEGFGAEVGLLEDYRNGENPYYLKCFHHNDKLGYINPGDTTCVLETDTCLQTYINPSLNIDNHLVQVYYTNNQIVIHNDFELKDLSIRVFNITGMQIYQSKVSSEILTIDANLFHNGLYLFSLQGSNKVLITQKVIINH